MIFTPTPEVVERASKISFEVLNRRWVMLIPYAVLFLVFAVLSGIALNRINKIKIQGDVTATVIIVFIIFAILILVGTLAYGFTLDWGKPIF